MFDQEWLGSAFQSSEPLYAHFDAKGKLERMGLRQGEKTIEVSVNPPQAITVEPMAEDLSLEEWLEGWRHQLLEAVEKKPFQPTCSFCGKTDREVRKIIAGPTVMICNECVDLCSEILSES